MKVSFIHIFKFPNGEEREIRAEILYLKMMIKTFLNFMTEKPTDSEHSANSNKIKKRPNSAF